MFRRLSGSIQPLGFACLLSYIGFGKNQLTFVLFAIGCLLTVIGLLQEVYQFQRTATKDRNHPDWLFWLGVIVKSLLMAGIVLRVLDVPNSLFILLGCIILAMLWGALAIFVGQEEKNHNDILDN